MFKRMFPELHVSDCEAAAQFFERALGFKRGHTHHEDGVLDFIVMTHAASKLTLLLHRMLPAEEVDKPRDCRLYFEPADIHALCRSLADKGYEVSPPEETYYGATEAHMRGPDGHMIWFQQWQPAPVI